VALVPDCAWKRSGLGSAGMPALCRCVQQANHFRAIGVSVGDGLDSGPRRIDDVEREGEAELSGRHIVAVRGQRDYCAHEIVCGHGREEFLFHHAFVAGPDMIQPDGPLQCSQIGFDVPASALHLQHLIDRKSERCKQVKN
jgi:hypothetical protein